MKIPMQSFHIPVMGLAYTIDTPIRVAQYGISSVVSVMDDELMEQLNCFYSEKFKLPYEKISRKMEDFRAKRITNYLNTLDTIVKKNLESLKQNLLNNPGSITDFIGMLPKSSVIKEQLQKYIDGHICSRKIKDFLDTHLHGGDIDVNIMTKVDRQAFDKNTPLPTLYNDAHAALRGYAQSNLHSSVVLSAGMNPKLFSYFESFPDFFPSEKGELNKKIVLKVSDYRSALLQGSYLAKKGLWVSEYRVESGLNCGGHAFATQGYLLGPILQEFKDNKEKLQETTFALLQTALTQKGLRVPTHKMPIKISAQGGVGTNAEHQLLLDYYKVDSVGWGSPFLLVEEATSVDKATRELLQKAQEKDLFLSNYSPLGIPFNTIRGSSNDYYKNQRIKQEKPGSACTRKYLALDTSHDPKGLCSASSKFQKIALEKLEAQRKEFSLMVYQNKKEAITQKACLCIGLSNPSLMEHNLDLKGQKQGVVICPGPNMAYFNQQVSLKQMIEHIYGQRDLINHPNRPNFFIKELGMYVDYFKEELKNTSVADAKQKAKKLQSFKDNLLQGILYYQELIQHNVDYFDKQLQSSIQALSNYKKELLLIKV
ncbi:hypothetical protein ACYSNM_09595 [Myroides sp. LJL116]